MGTLVCFGEVVKTPVAPQNKLSVNLEVWDNHGKPEIAIGPNSDGDYTYIISFDDKKQLERLIDALGSALQRAR